MALNPLVALGFSGGSLHVPTITWLFSLSPTDQRCGWMVQRMVALILQLRGTTTGMALLMSGEQRWLPLNAVVEFRGRWSILWCNSPHTGSPKKSASATLPRWLGGQQGSYKLHVWWLQCCSRSMRNCFLETLNGDVHLYTRQHTNVQNSADHLNPGNELIQTINETGWLKTFYK